MSLYGIKANGTITALKGRQTNTIGYSGNPKEMYILNYNVNSKQQHAQLSFFRRLLGR